MQCVYPSIPSQLFGSTGLIPWVVPMLFFTAGITKRNGRWGNQIAMVMYGKWMLLVQTVLYIIQTYVDAQRADPYCPDLLSYASPSMPIFYASAGIFYVVFFTLFWGIALPWTYWVILVLVWAHPAFLLSWFYYNTVTEVLVSTLIGAATPALFLLVVRFWILDDIPFMLTQVPWRWMACTDTQIMMDEQERTFDQIHRVTKL